jgi:starvation-inducible DNA-binding protein
LSGEGHRGVNWLIGNKAFVLTFVGWRFDKKRRTPMATKQTERLNIGLTDTDRKSIVSGLEKLLADTYMLYLKTLFFHWNVTGPMFQPLHDVFEGQYQELLLAADEIAERIRSLGYPAPGTFREFSRLTSIQEETSVPDAMSMIKLLVSGHETVIRTAREIVSVCDKADDIATDDLITRRTEAHEKTAWMLRSFLE